MLVDEPEAFLHPPQARSLARQFIELKSAQSQVFVATHDSNIVRGLLEAASEDGLTIVRIQRSGERNPVAILGNQDVKRLWDNPSLRYSNALDGLFHTGVVVCESDGDCRLYESVMDELDPTDGAPDLLFTHGGGIARVPTLVSAFKSVGTPTAAIVDIDILQEDTRLEGIVSALGIDTGKWQYLGWPTGNNSKRRQSTINIASDRVGQAGHREGLRRFFRE